MTINSLPHTLGPISRCPLQVINVYKALKKSVPLALGKKVLTLTPTPTPAPTFISENIKPKHKSPHPPPEKNPTIDKQNQLTYLT